MYLVIGIHTLCGELWSSRPLSSCREYDMISHSLQRCESRFASAGNQGGCPMVSTSACK